jgi:hypothetical protein
MSLSGQNGVEGFIISRKPDKVLATK